MLKRIMHIFRLSIFDLVGEIIVLGCFVYSVKSPGNVVMSGIIFLLFVLMNIYLYRDCKRRYMKSYISRKKRYLEMKNRSN